MNTQPHLSPSAAWAGEFGTNYTQRNEGRIEANIQLFARALTRVAPLTSVLEIGCGSGQNLAAIKALRPRAKMMGVEINPDAAAQARAYGEIRNIDVLEEDYLEPADLVLTKGLLIHIAPEDLQEVYDTIMRAAKRYVLICEYYAPHPVEVKYREHKGLLWKRDFAGEMLERYRYLRLIDYGFVYRRDPVAAQDDLTWFLMEKDHGG